METANNNEATILVMGSTGAGKSTFVQLVTGESDVGVGHGLTASML